MSLANSIRVYYAYGIARGIQPVVLGYLSRFGSPSSSHYSTRGTASNGIEVCMATDVSNHLQAVDGSLDNFATFASVVSVNCPTSLQVKLEGTAPAGYFAGFTVGSSGLLDVAALEGLTLSTYLDGSLQETAAGKGLSKLLLLPNGQQQIYFLAMKPFNQVQIRGNSLLGALNNLLIYYAFGVEQAALSGSNRVFSTFTQPTVLFHPGQFI